jgi:hypothetical protein
MKIDSEVMAKDDALHSVSVFDKGDSMSLFSHLVRVVSRFMIPVVLIAFAAPFVALLFYSLPATDDFCKASLSFGAVTPVPQRGVLNVTWLYYTQWSPRWLTTLLQSSVMSHVDLPRAYGWLLLTVILSNLVGLWYFFRTVVRLPQPRALLAAGIFYAAYVASLSDAPQQLYWLTGAIEYSLSFTTLLILFSLLYKASRSLGSYVAIALLSIAIPAEHEIAGTLLCLLLLCWIAMAQIKRTRAPQLYVSLGFAVLSEAVVVFAPGNAIRAAQEHRHMWDIAHLPRWAAHSAYHGLNWLAYPSILIAGCCIILLCQSDTDNSGADRLPPRWLGAAALGAMFIVLFEVAFIEMATGIWLPYRVSTWFEFVFWLLFVFVVFAGIPEIYRTRFSLKTRVGIFTLFAVTLLGSSNFRAAVEDLRGPAQSWWRVDSARLRQHRAGVLEFEGPTHYPNMAYHQNLSANPGCFVNQCMANYLGAQTVVVRNSSEECPP